MENEKKHWALSLLESVFGKFKSPSTESKKRRCIRCRQKYDPTAVRTYRPSPDAPAIEFDSNRFCSYLCSTEITGKNVATRQSRRHALRQTAKVSIAHTMGAGPIASNPRRARRKAMLEMAKRLYREG